MESALVIADCGQGNFYSIARALRHVAPPGMDIQISAEADTLKSATRLVLPGVGAMGDCIRGLHTRGLHQVIKEHAKTKPLLAICVGMQMLMEQSQENPEVEGLSLLAGGVSHITQPLTANNQALLEQAVKIPHMGWNKVHQKHDHPMWQGIKDDAWFYFVHSYCVDAQDNLVSATTTHGRLFPAALAQQNIFAVQFHPEKSQQDGLTLLANFCTWDGRLTC